jgi:hypothetical protein
MTFFFLNRYCGLQRKRTQSLLDVIQITTNVCCSLELEQKKNGGIFSQMKSHYEREFKKLILGKRSKHTKLSNKTALRLVAQKFE